MLTPIKDYPAIIYKQKRRKTLIIADVHLGWEISLAKRGVHVPSQMPKILQRLLQLIKITKPNTLIILGDVKHTIAKAERGEWRDIPEFFKTIRSKVEDIQIVRGNHDGNLEPLLHSTIQLHPSKGLTLNSTGIFHGHTWPAKKLLECNTLIMGHVHPTVAFRDSFGFQMTTPVWIKARCNGEKLAAASSRLRGKHGRTMRSRTHSKKTVRKQLNITPRVRQLFIMPCFNDFLGGRPVNKKSESRRSIGPVLRSESVNIDESEAYLLDGTFLGTMKQLKALNSVTRADSSRRRTHTK